MNIRRNDGAFTLEGIVLSALGGCISILLLIMGYTTRTQIEATQSLEKSVTRLQALIEEHNRQIAENKKDISDLNTVVFEHLTTVKGRN